MEMMLNGLSVSCYRLASSRKCLPNVLSRLFSVAAAEFLHICCWSSWWLQAGHNWERGNVKDRYFPNSSGSCFFSGRRWTCPCLQLQLGRWACDWSAPECMLHRFMGNSYRRSKLVRVCQLPFSQFHFCQCACKSPVIAACLFHLLDKRIDLFVNPLCFH